MKILVTGATGFIGRVVVDTLFESGHTVLAAVRCSGVEQDFPSGVEVVAVGDIGPETDWSQCLRDVAAVIHLAGRAHQLNDSASDPEAEFHKINVLGTMNLAASAREHGALRFVFVSSIGVNGNGQVFPYRGNGYTSGDVPNPHDMYAFSKLEAETNLKNLSKHNGLDLVIVRPTLVYGPNAPGNLSLLIKLIRKGLPIPLRGIKNRRSLIGVNNLADILMTCSVSPKAASQTFVASDGILTSETLCTLLGDGIGVKARLITVPRKVLSFLAKLLKREKTFQSLAGDLVVDSSLCQEVLDWIPKISIEEGIRLCGKAEGKGRAT